MKEITYEIVKNVGVISINERGWTKELNVVAFNEMDPKYDIREWSPDKKKMSKGIRLSQAELDKLHEIIAAIGM